MTGPFSPRPSPDHYDAFECDSNAHPCRQHVRPLIRYVDQEGHGWEGHDYIFKQDAGKRGKNSEVLLSNQPLSNLRAANARPKSPSHVSRFIHHLQ